MLLLSTSEQLIRSKDVNILQNQFQGFKAKALCTYTTCPQPVKLKSPPIGIDQSGKVFTKTNTRQSNLVVHYLFR